MPFGHANRKAALFSVIEKLGRRRGQTAQLSAEMFYLFKNGLKSRGAAILFQAPSSLTSLWVN